MSTLRIINCLSSHFELALDKRRKTTEMGGGRPARHFMNHKRVNDLRIIKQEALEMSGQTDSNKIAMADADDN
jgi:hypothetical protein